ncbi:transferase family-domain-containing protein [Aspergillus bertholletiae]|uniref:Transferase family-domain-containing protein n=1 Tax=Aspergillus bertholletiae TaxID=1226010 RepID=A0A5N7AVI2_9EURO|nr:transferase family-domain-containing protein [Aspergillus bertholletiae]
MDSNSPTRLFPLSRSHEPASVALSILDATVVRFAPTGAIWLFEDFAADENTLLRHLQASLIQTLDRFPQWAGQLQWAPFQPGRTHRPMIAFNTASDPGVEWSVVRLAQPIASFAPTASERARNGAWAGDAFTQNIFLSETRLALANLRDYEGLPAMTIQITLFDGAGFAIGIKMAHCLADAQALMVFVHQWAAACRVLHGHANAISPMDDPVFDPSVLDAKASGDIHAETPDPALLATARSLPLHRFDWWETSDPDYPPAMVPNTENSRPSSEYLPPDTTLSPSTPAPWATWDGSKQVTYTQLHFTGPELDHLRHLARSQLPTSHSPETGPPIISRLDALLAHIWQLITQARALQHCPDQVYLNVTLGARPRLIPPLPPSSLGSPIFIAHAHARATDICASPLGHTAARIRAAIQHFQPDTLGAMLYDAGREVAPQRLWQGFMGQRHTLVTSWLRTGVYDVGFDGRALRPRYVHAVIPKMDGCLQVMDSGVLDGGIDLAVYLDAETAQWVVDHRWDLDGYLVDS